MKKCKHRTKGLVGEFNQWDGCLDCGKVILKKQKKRKSRVTYPLPKCYISTRSGQYKRLEKDSKTLKLIIKHKLAVDKTCSGDFIVGSILGSYISKKLHSAVKNAVRELVKNE